MKKVLILIEHASHSNGGFTKGEKAWEESTRLEKLFSFLIEFVGGVKGPSNQKTD